MIRQTKLSLSNSPKIPLLPRPWTPPCRVKQPPPWPPRIKPLPGPGQALIAKAMITCRAASWFLLCSVKAWSKDTSFSMLLCAGFGLDAGFADEEEVEVDHHQAVCMFLFAQPLLLHNGGPSFLHYTKGSSFPGWSFDPLSQKRVWFGINKKWWQNCLAYVHLY